MNISNLLLLLLNIISFGLVIRYILISYRQFMSLLLLYSIASLYFVVIPLLADVMSVALGYDTIWKLLISDNPLAYPYSLDVEVLWRVSIFVFLFNIIFYISFFIFQKKKSQKSSYLELQRVQGKNEKIYMYFFILLGWFGFFLFVILHGFHWELKGFSYIERAGTTDIPFLSVVKIIMRSSLALSGIGVFFSSYRKKYFILLLALTPSILIVLLTSERPFLLPVLICAMYGMYARSIKDNNSFSFKYIFMALAAIYVIPSAFFIVRNGISSIVEILPYPLHRDSSFNNLYYVFSNIGGYNEVGTGFTNIIRLLTTGVLPSSLFGKVFDNSLDVTRYLAIERFNWKTGTLHPTLYGWAFVDMKWFGLLFAIFIAFILSIPSRFKNSPTFIRIGLCSIAALFILVSMRGSVQFSYAIIFYGFLYLLLIYMVLKKIPRKIQRGKHEI